jgi:hypothetical protein
MTKHGFTREPEFEISHVGEDFVDLVLTASEQTKNMYPFDFAFHVTYRLFENGYTTTFLIENRSDRVMPCCAGGHPGFIVPMEKGAAFEDYRIVFSQKEEGINSLAPGGYLIDGEEKLKEMQEVTMPKLRAQAEASGDPMAVQVVADFEGSVQRFEKKVHDLKVSKTIAIQTAPQIRLIQNNDKALVDRVQTAIYNTIPLWKNQMVIALGLKAQQDTLRLQQAVTNTTNELLKRNAEMLKQNTVEVAKENERSIVDIETVREVNDKLISTIEETLRIQQDGRAKRAAAEQELVQIEGRLRDTLLKHSGRTE